MKILPIIVKDFNAQILIWVPLSPIKAIVWESAENDECLYFEGIYWGRFLIGWWECNGE